MIYRVGGAVRDLILGRDPKDHDFVVVGETVEEFQRNWPTAKAIGKSFPVFQVVENGLTMEFAFARRERKVGPGHGGFEVEADTSVTLEEDLLRRDLTVNAMALPLVYRNNLPIETFVIDPYGGLFDLKARVLRHVGPAFTEDPLRVYRLARFACTLGFGIAKETQELVAAMDKSDLYRLSGERVAEETRKAMKSEHPALYFYLLRDFFSLEPWFPDLMRLVGVPAGPPGHHDEIDAFEHTMMVLERASWIDANDDRSQELIELVRWAALTHDLGKGITPRDQWPRHLNHEQNGVHLVERFYDRLKMPADFKAAAVLACSEHLKVHNFLDMKKGKMVDLIRRADRTKLGAEGLAMVAIADALGRVAKDKSVEGPKALLACADAAREETGHPIPEALQGEAIGLHIRNRKGSAVRRVLKEHGYIGQDRANGGN
jgi:tRNA nucleotidyltransferase (CCA-adding enzyme)